jgi:transcriptional regulator with XRE-family HTH domain
MHPVVRRIRALCDERRMSYAELGRRAGFTTQASQKWFRGESLPALETRMRIARELGIPFESLLDGATETTPPMTSDEVIEQYIQSPIGEDLSEEEARQLRLSAAWVPGNRALTWREVSTMAEFLRMRLRNPEQVVVLNPPGAPQAPTSGPPPLEPIKPRKRR